MQITKSPNDKRSYQALSLENGLRILLVCDPDSERSAAALAVNIGHFHDPDDRPGMAHFLEHMLFLGTDHYPQAGEYNEFLSQHGGQHNAWTGTEHTCFFFDIEAPFFEPALDRFSRFFIAPLLTPELVDKERRAIESEFQLKLRDDTRRLYQVHKETVNPDHPFCKFSVGNLQTLDHRPGRSLHEELVSFYHQHYSADRMTLVLTSSHSLAQLTAWATEKFSAIPYLAEQPVLALPPLYRTADLSCEIAVQTLKAMRKMVITFPLGNPVRHYRSKPTTFISHLLGHEGQDSLTSYLKHLGWINTLTAGTGIRGSNYIDFNIAFNLTETGLEHVDDITEAVFQYIELISRQGLEDWRYEEKHLIHEQLFKFSEPQTALDWTTHLVMNMQHYPPQDYIYGDYAMDGLDKELTRSYLAQMTPDKMRITLAHPAVTGEQTTQWYETCYARRPFSDEQLHRWYYPAPLPEHLKLPPRNPFVLSELKARPLEMDKPEPEMITQAPGIHFWFGQDQEIHPPKGHLYVSMESPAIGADIKTRAMSRVLIEMLQDHLTDLTYQAEMAGLGYDLFAHASGMSLHMGGFSGRQSFLLELVLANLISPQLQENRFREIRNQLIHNLTNSLDNRPIARLFSQLSSMLQPAHPDPLALRDALATLEFSELVEFSASWYQQLHIEALAYGDYTRNEAHAISDHLRYIAFKEAQPATAPQSTIVNINGHGTLLHELDNTHQDSAVLVYYQAQQNSPFNVALYALAQHLIAPTFFHELRTRQQLGYLVGCNYMPLNRYPGLVMYVQSNVAPPLALVEAIDEFIELLPARLATLSEDDFNYNKRALIQQLLEKESTLKGRSQHYWVAIGHKDYQFNQRQRIARELRHLTLNDLGNFFAEHFTEKNHDRLVLQTCGVIHENRPLFLDGNMLSAAEQLQQHCSLMYARPV